MENMFREPFLRVRLNVTPSGYPNKLSTI